MELLTEILMKSYIDRTILKLKNSLDEIKENHPTRTDLINSMQESLTEMAQVKVYVLELLDDNRVLRHETSDLRRSNMKMIVDIGKLEKSLSEAIKGI